MYIHGIYHVYTSTWYIHGIYIMYIIHGIYMVYTWIYMAFTWYIPCKLFLLVPDGGINNVRHTESEYGLGLRCWLPRLRRRSLALRARLGGRMMAWTWAFQLGNPETDISPVESRECILCRIYMTNMQNMDLLLFSIFQTGWHIPCHTFVMFCMFHLFYICLDTHMGRAFVKSYEVLTSGKLTD
jgi:hypothetical protein